VPAIEIPVAGAGLRFQVDKDGQLRQTGVKSGAELLADGLAWPLTAARTAVLWLLSTHPSP
jgi:hypothetical protein